LRRGVLGGYDDYYNGGMKKVKGYINKNGGSLYAPPAFFFSVVKNI